MLYRSVEPLPTAWARWRPGGDGRSVKTSANFDALAEDIRSPAEGAASSLALARLGTHSLPASTLPGGFATRDSGTVRGVAAHAFRPLHYLMTSAIGWAFTAGHRHGGPCDRWVVDHQRASLAADRPRRQDRNRTRIETACAAAGR